MKPNNNNNNNKFNGHITQSLEMTLQTKIDQNISNNNNTKSLKDSQIYDDNLKKKLQ